MDLATLIGLISGVVVIGLAVAVGSDLWIFLNLPGFLIVLGGGVRRDADQVPSFDFT